MWSLLISPRSLTLSPNLYETQGSPLHDDPMFFVPTSGHDDKKPAGDRPLF